MNSFEFIRKFNWIYQQIQIFWKYCSFLLFGFFEEIINELRNEFIELNWRLKSILKFDSFFCFCFFFVILLYVLSIFLKSKSLSWISNSFRHSINEFTDEFIDFNLIIFCERHTGGWTLRLLESPNLIDHEEDINDFVL